MADLSKSARIKKPEPTYPPDHKAAMEVPKGGSSCANCEYLGKDHKKRPICRNTHFIKWHGSMILPLPPERFCSDWWQAAKGAL